MSWLSKKLKKVKKGLSKLKVPSALKKLGSLAATAATFVPGLGPVVTKAKAVVDKLTKGAKKKLTDAYNKAKSTIGGLQNAAGTFIQARDDTNDAMGNPPEDTRKGGMSGGLALALAALGIGVVVAKQRRII